MPYRYTYRYTRCVQYFANVYTSTRLYNYISRTYVRMSNGLKVLRIWFYWIYIQINNDNQCAATARQLSPTTYLHCPSLVCSLHRIFSLWPRRHNNLVNHAIYSPSTLTGRALAYLRYISALGFRRHLVICGSLRSDRPKAQTHSCQKARSCSKGFGKIGSEEAGFGSLGLCRDIQIGTSTAGRRKGTRCVERRAANQVEKARKIRAQHKHDADLHNFHSLVWDPDSRVLGASFKYSSGRLVESGGKSRHCYFGFQILFVSNKFRRNGNQNFKVGLAKSVIELRGLAGFLVGTNDCSKNHGWGWSPLSAVKKKHNSIFCTNHVFVALLSEQEIPIFYSTLFFWFFVL